MDRIILTINPGSTSTKIGLFSGLNKLIAENIYHDPGVLSQVSTIDQQLATRLSYIWEFINKAESNDIIKISDIAIVMARGGLLGPVRSGIYVISEEMKDVLRQELYGCHASNLGALIADRIGNMIQVPAYIVDPPTVDEMSEIARCSGLSVIKRQSVFHALNHKAAARAAAKYIGRKYEEINLIVCHMGGGISVGLHNHGKVVDVNNALEEGPMSPERAGTLPTLSLLHQFVDSNMSFYEFRQIINGKGGLFSYTGSSDEKSLEAVINTNQAAKKAIDAMVYQISKEIGALAAAAAGRIDTIVLTGGLARSSYICEAIENKTAFIAKCIRFPGERELEALAAAGMRYLTGETEPLRYKAVNRKDVGK